MDKAKLTNQETQSWASEPQGKTPPKVLDRGVQSRRATGESPSVLVSIKSGVQVTQKSLSFFLGCSLPQVKPALSKLLVSRWRGSIFCLRVHRDKAGPAPRFSDLQPGALSGALLLLHLRKQPHLSGYLQLQFLLLLHMLVLPLDGEP